MPTCRLTGQPFEISPLEKKLLETLGGIEPTTLPHLRTRHLGAFWPHWALHKRTCDLTGREIVSVFGPECAYPVWHKDQWFKNANPPKALFDFSQPFFPQTEKFFKRCPIAHNSGTNNENCEYTDDWWYGKNCFLSHSGLQCENTRYCYRCFTTKDSLYCTFSFDTQRSIDCVNCDACYETVYGLYLKNCRSVAFSYDCRNCTDCLFCFNLRSKHYCIGNQQLTKEQFEIQKKQFDYSTASGYLKCQQLFQKMMKEIAWHRSSYQDQSENTGGNYVQSTKDCEHIYFLSEARNCVNVVRGVQDMYMELDCLSCPLKCDHIYNSVCAQVSCSNVRCSFQLTESRFVDYSAYSAQLENCFACCGLVGGKNCIMNTSYSVQEYAVLRDKIIAHMKTTGEWGQFFPGSFAPNTYNESWSSFYFPLSPSEQVELGYFYLSNPERHNVSYRDITSLPTTAQEANETTTQETYWDDIAQKPFQILAQDINLCRELGVALPHTHYMRRIQENFRWMPYNGALRTTTCAKSGKSIQTSWPSEYDGRIVCEEEYLKIVG